MWPAQRKTLYSRTVMRRLAMRSRCSAGGIVARAVQRIGGLLDVVRVDDQRLGHLARGAGEAAQDQHALLVVARGDELLAHQVHAVVQAGDHADVGGAEQLGDRVVLVVLGEQVHRLVAAAGRSAR